DGDVHRAPPRPGQRELEGSSTEEFSSADGRGSRGDGASSGTSWKCAAASRRARRLSTTRALWMATSNSTISGSAIASMVSGSRQREQDPEPRAEEQVGEDGAAGEQRRRGHDETHRVATLVALEAGRDEGPELVEPDRCRQDGACEEGHLEPDEHAAEDVGDQQ